MSDTHPYSFKLCLNENDVDIPEYSFSKLIIFNSGFSIRDFWFQLLQKLKSTL